MPASFCASWVWSVGVGSGIRQGYEESWAEITTLIESGMIKPMVDRSFPLESTADALSYVEQGRAKGKVVIKVK